MATLIYDLIDSDSAITRIEVRESSETWKNLTAMTGKLCVDDGTVDDRDNDLTLLGVKDGTPRVVLVLKGTGYGGAEGDKGQASCDCCDTGCDPAPTWKLANVE